jgi:hypothetical protein
MARLPGGRIPSVVDRAIVSTGPGGPTDGATLSPAEGGGADVDAEADAVAPTLDDGAVDSAGEPLEQPASTMAIAAVSILAFVMQRS